MHKETLNTMLTPPLIINRCYVVFIGSKERHARCSFVRTGKDLMIPEILFLTPHSL
jgi:hypothetical protein